MFREDSGAFYGRGANDNKSGAAMLVANMIRWKREGWAPDRDVIMLLTTDEETDAVAGIQYVLAHHRDLIDAEFCPQHRRGQRGAQEWEAVPERGRRE
ncbi:MAG: M20/M25/M40 family metallo-hydrolase [Gemmatimonadaceae bacterium]